MNSKFSIAIDLGTTFSILAKYQDGLVQIIKDFESKKLIPSYICIESSDPQNEDAASPGYLVEVGDAAMRKAVKTPKNVFYDAKRIIGQQYKDVEEMAKTIWKFDVIDCKGVPYIEVPLNERKQLFKPEEMSSEVLKYLKNVADDHFEVPVTDVVVTVPARFTNKQRHATISAAKLAGFEKVVLLNEPTAAALAFQDTDEDTHITLVFDFGGGTLDISLLEVTRGHYQTLVTHGDQFLGGQDFTDKLFFYCSERYQNSLSKVLDEKSQIHLRAQCNDAKIRLSNSTVSTVTVEIEDFILTISIQQFEQICSDLFNCVRQCLDATMEKARDNVREFSEKSIRNVLLVGGSSRIRKIQKDLKEYFEDAEISKKVDADEAVAKGAAIYAGIRHNPEGKLLVDDITPYALGISALDKDGTTVFVRIIPQFSLLPIEMHECVTTTNDGQTKARIKIYEEESDDIEKNEFLQSFVLENVEEAEKHQPSIVVCFQVDDNGILTVSATDKKTKSTEKIVIAARCAKRDATDEPRREKKMKIEEIVLQ